MRIKRIRGEIILNSKGDETIEITVNKKYKGSVGSGGSVGKYEVMAYPKSGVPLRFVNDNLAEALRGVEVNDFDDLADVENVIKSFDESDNWSFVGGNVVVALEFALLQAMSDNSVWKFLNPNAAHMPIPLGNCIGGGKHALNRGINVSDIQEFLLIPRGENFNDNAFANHYTHRAIGRVLKASVKDDEGAWVTEMSNLETLEFLSKIVKNVSNELGFRVELGIDAAASCFFNNGFYEYKNFSKDKKNKKLSVIEQIDFISELIRKYNLKYVEDPFQEDDFNSYSALRKSFRSFMFEKSKELRKETLICGDDLTCTNLNRLKKGIEHGINAVIIKPNQIGSLIKTKKAVEMAFENNIIPVMSHRDGETMDRTIAHLAVAWNMPYVKFGIYGKTREAKIQELKRIEEEINRR